MNLEIDSSYADLRGRARLFCERSWPLTGDEAQLPRREQEILWHERAIAAKLLHRTVPEQYGGGGLAPDPIAETIITGEFTACGVPFLSNSPNGPRFLVPALLECGTEAQRETYIRPTLSGRMNWCQGYSEPGAGSDLASLTAKAVVTDGEWVINGQKIWTSLAKQANMMFGLFRTEEGRQKHSGISFLLVPMDSPGLVVRPIRGLHGGSDFCEVFFDNVHVPIENIVGERGAGWNVSKAVLKYERLQLTDASYVRGQFDSLVALARMRRADGKRPIDDSIVRQRLVEIEGAVASQEWSVARILTAMDRGRDGDVSAELLTGKLLSTNTQEAIAKLAIDIVGSGGLYEPSEPERDIKQYMPAKPSVGDWINRYFVSLAIALGGGTSNIHRNIIGERLLGLPRDLYAGGRNLSSSKS